MSGGRAPAVRRARGVLHLCRITAANLQHSAARLLPFGMSIAKYFLLALLTTSASLLAGQASDPHQPKLVLAIVVDQFRYDYLLRFRDAYNSGLNRLLDQGAVFTDAHYLHAATVTAVGHSTFMTGATPSVSGIIANEWFDRKTAQM